MVGICKENIQMLLDAFKLFYIRKRVSHNVPSHAAPAMTATQDSIHTSRNSFVIEFVRNNEVSSSIPEVASITKWKTFISIEWLNGGCSI